MLNRESQARNNVNQNEHTLNKLQQAKKTAEQDREQVRLTQTHKKNDGEGDGVYDDNCLYICRQENTM